MADAITKLRANLAMVRSVGTIVDDVTLDRVSKARAFATNAEQYADYIDCPIAEATEFVGSIAKRLAAGSSLIPPRREKLPHEKDHFEEPDQHLIGEEEKKMRHATNGEMLKLAQSGLAAEVAKIRAENPRLTEHQARKRCLAANPDLYASLRKLAHGPENDLAKQRPSGAAAEVAAKTAEIQKAHPELTEAQAYTRAVETTPRTDETTAR